MKKIIFILSICFAFYLNGKAQQTISWNSFENALAINAQSAQPKKIFVDVYTDWCGWCKRMDATTFADPKIAELMNKYFIPVKFDAERKDTIWLNNQAYVNVSQDGRRSSHQVAQMLLNGKMSYPSYSFIDEQGKQITAVPGYMDVAQFEMVLSYFASDAYKSTSWEDYQKNFKDTITE